MTGSFREFDKAAKSRKTAKNRLKTPPNWLKRGSHQKHGGAGLFL
jgi:hypothetical protein